MPHLTARRQAVKNLEVADHLLRVTFPLVKDPKLLIGIIQNLSDAMTYAMDSILTYERQLFLVPKYSKDYHSRLAVFQLKSVKRHKIDRKYLLLMQSLRDLLELHKKSSMVFQRGNRYVICGDNYDMHVLSLTKLRGFSTIAQEFLAQTDKIIKHNRK